VAGGKDNESAPFECGAANKEIRLRVDGFLNGSSG